MWNTPGVIRVPSCLTTGVQENYQIVTSRLPRQTRLLCPKWRPNEIRIDRWTDLIPVTVGYYAIPCRCVRLSMLNERSTVDYYIFQFQWVLCIYQKQFCQDHFFGTQYRTTYCHGETEHLLSPDRVSGTAFRDPSLSLTVFRKLLKTYLFV